jgi:DNA invertase Pin-like site-specific DNA recombinase
MSDLVRTLDDLKAAGIDLYLHGQDLDTSTPTGKALFGMLGVFAEFERSMIVARVKAGLERARVTGTRTGNPVRSPRPVFQEDRVRPYSARQRRQRARCCEAGGDQQKRSRQAR